MGKQYDELSDEHVAWIGEQHVFFVATAPTDGGHVNVSPKGYDAFRILDRRTVSYLDLTGSGVETISHLRENGRITVMFCGFEGRPRILRLQGRGTVVGPDAPDWAELAAGFPLLPGARAVVRIDLERIATSCGYGVPLMTFAGDRPTLHEWAERKGDEGLADYRRRMNARSIDGLPGL